MGPKRSRASSSRESNESRRNRLRETLLTRSLNPGRPVNLTNLEVLATWECFSAINWQPFLNFGGDLFVDPIVEFYSGYNFNSTDNVVTVYLYGQEYVWDLDRFAVLLGLSRSHNRVYNQASSFDSIYQITGVSQQTIVNSIFEREHQNDFNPGHLTDQLLTPRHRFWNKIILFNVLGRAGNTERLTCFQCYILYCLANHVSLDATYIVAHRMDGIDSGHRSLPFGYLIRNVFRNLNLPFHGRPIQSPAPLDNNTVVRMNAAHALPQAPAPEPADPYGMPPGQISMRDIYSLVQDHRRETHEGFGNLTQMVQTVSNRYDDLHQDVWNLREEFRGWRMGEDVDSDDE